ncbi:MAG: hypothetical protein E6J23_11025 [Chloroflexi bacterium]|nr:MAG: hypothetical protein E6J23_11025 [Chloroflexota bacterium]
MRRLVVIGLVMAFLASLSPATFAATPPSGSVDNVATTTNPISGNAACDVYSLTVNVASSFWTNTAGGVAVRLDNFGANDIDMYIYQRNSDGTKGAFVTSSGNAIGMPENAIIDSASGGYYVVAVAFSVVATSYQGHATFFVTAGHAPTPPVITSPPGYPANRASRDVYLSHSEPHIAMNPLDHNNLVAGSKMYVNLPNYLFKIGMYASFDGGRTWTDSGQLPGYPVASPADCTGGANGQTFSADCQYTTSDVWTAFDDEGNAYAMVLDAPGGAAGATGWNMNLHKSTDGGRTWSVATPIHNHNGGLLKDFFLDDKNAFAVDNYTAAPLGGTNKPRDGKIGTMYACWNLDDTTAGLHQDIVVATSNDGGQTWSQPVIVSKGQDLEIGCQFGIAPSGTVFLSWFHYTTTIAGLGGQMWIAESLDHGLTWTAPTVVATVNPLPTKIPGSRFRNLSIPGMAIAPNGTIYITWADYHTAANGTQDGDILVAKSTNGINWTTSRVNQDKIGNGKDQFQPQIAITASGQVNISYFDRRNDPDNFYIDTYLSRSDDGGTMADDDNAIPFWNDTHLAQLPTTDANYSKYQEVFSARVPNLADLTVSGLTFGPSAPREGQTVTITARVANIGYRAASNIGVRFAVDGVVQSPDRSIASLAAGATADVSIQWPSQGKPGTHTVLVTVDPKNTIRESDETNNAGTGSFFVRGNKVSNPSFETASTTAPSQPANWTPSGTGTTYDVTGGHAADGIAAAGIVTGALPGQAGKWTSDAVAVVAGTYYEVSATVITGGTASQPRIVVSALNTVSGATTPLLALTQLVPAKAVTELLAGVTIPAGVSTVVIELRDELDANLTVYYDKIGLFAPD